jgi:hypothetical protein
LPESTTAERRQPLRFVWQMDADGGLRFDSDEFVTVIGPQSAKLLSRPWREVAAELALDPQGQILRAIASRDTWSGIVVAFPVDGTEQRLPIELSGLPVFDRERNFVGYRGFGVCRDAARIVELARLHRDKRAPQAPKPDAPNMDAAPEPKSDTKPMFEPRYEPPVLREERPALTVVPPSRNRPASRPWSARRSASSPAG